MIMILSGCGSAGYHVLSRHREVGAPLQLSSTSFDADADQTPNALDVDDEACLSRGAEPYAAPGMLKNVNTLESFKTLDRQQLLLETAEKVWADILSGAAITKPELLNRFLVFTYADLKKFTFYYW